MATSRKKTEDGRLKEAKTLPSPSASALKVFCFPARLITA